MHESQLKQMYKTLQSQTVTFFCYLAKKNPTMAAGSVSAPAGSMSSTAAPLLRMAVLN